MVFSDIPMDDEEAMDTDTESDDSVTPDDSDTNDSADDNVVDRTPTPLPVLESINPIINGTSKSPPENRAQASEELDEYQEAVMNRFHSLYDMIKPGISPYLMFQLMHSSITVSFDDERQVVSLRVSVSPQYYEEWQPFSVEFLELVRRISAISVEAISAARPGLAEPLFDAIVIQDVRNMVDPIPRDA